MWIVPLNHPLSSAFARDRLDSKGDWNELSGRSILPLTVRSKRTAVTTWLRGWKRVYWRSLLSGRMLKPSRQKSFEEKLTVFLADTRASLSAVQASGKEETIQDTFSRIYSDTLKQLDLFSVSSKTSGDTLPWDIPKFIEAYGKLAMQLSAASIQRKKLAHHIRETAYLSSPSLTTPPRNYITGSSTHTGLQNGSTASYRELADSHCIRSGTNAGDSGDTGKKIEGTQQWQERNNLFGQWNGSNPGNSSTALAYTSGQRFEEQREVRKQGKPENDRTIDTGASVADTDSQGLEKRGIQPGQTRSSLPERSGLFHGWPAGPGGKQYDWEAPRTVKSGLGCTINGYNYREDLLRTLGNAVVEQTAEVAFLDLSMQLIGRLIKTC